MATRVQPGDRVRIHPRRQFKITSVYPWLRQRSWHTVEAVVDLGGGAGRRSRIGVVIKNPASDERATVWRMDVRKPRPGAEKKLAMEGA